MSAVHVFDLQWKRFPRVIVFDVDETLWPFWIDTHTSPPYKRDASGQIKDGSGNTIELFAETEKVLTTLRTVEGLQIAFASRTGAPSWMEELARLVKFKANGVTSSMWDLPDYREIYPGSKLTHFRNIAEKSGFGCDEMLFFDDEPYSNKEVTTLGVTFVDASGGITAAMVQKGLEQFEAAHS